MIKLITPIVAIFLLSTGSANAASALSSNQAVTVCKAHFKDNVEGYKRAKVADMRSSRSSHKITFRVISESGKTKSKCVVNKADGSIEML